MATIWRTSSSCTKEILQFPVIVLGPAVGPSRGIDKLCSNANAVSDPPYAAFQHIVHAQFAPDLAHINRLTLVLKARVASDHEQLTEPRQLCDDVVDDAVGQVLLLLTATQIGEGEDGD